MRRLRDRHRAVHLGAGHPVHLRAHRLLVVAQALEAGQGADTHIAWTTTAPWNVGKRVLNSKVAMTALGT